MATPGAKDPGLVSFLTALNSQCQPQQVKNSVRLDVYYRMAQQLLMQGRNYMKMGEYEHAYVYLKRFAYLVLHTIASHNAFRMPRYRTQSAWAKREADAVLTDLKVIKEHVVDRYHQRMTEQAHDARARAKERSAGAGAGSGAGAGGGGGKPDDAEAAPLDAATLRAFDALRVGPSSGSAGSSSYPARTSKPAPSKPRAAAAHYDVDSLATGQLRRVHVPVDIPATFLQIASRNSNTPPYGIETCGILAGVVAGPRLVKVTHLIIPPQTGSSDTVAMTDDGEIQLFTYCTSNELLALGWIHTHPSQKCFLSSVDVHTHCAYQIMMPEALAIVMAPKDPSMPCGIFHLTDQGLATVRDCEMTGFHEHPSGIRIYQACAHVDLVETKPKVVDLRR